MPNYPSRKGHVFQHFAQFSLCDLNDKKCHCVGFLRNRFGICQARKKLQMPRHPEFDVLQGRSDFLDHGLIGLFCQIGFAGIHGEGRAPFEFTLVLGHQMEVQVAAAIAIGTVVDLIGKFRQGLSLKGLQNHLPHCFILRGHPMPVIARHKFLLLPRCFQLFFLHCLLEVGKEGIFIAHRIAGV